MPVVSTTTASISISIPWLFREDWYAVLSPAEPRSELLSPGGKFGQIVVSRVRPDPRVLRREEGQGAGNRRCEGGLLQGPRHWEVAGPAGDCEGALFHEKGGAA